MLLLHLFLFAGGLRAGEQATERRRASHNPKHRHVRHRKDEKDSDGCKKRYLHANTWSLRKVIELAFKEIGMVDSRSRFRRGEVGAVHGGLSAVFVGSWVWLSLSCLSSLAF
jgi:hypothetical protein